MARFPGSRCPCSTGPSRGSPRARGRPRRLDATYYDTPGLTLARWGITVRHRLGEGLPWTVKLPEGEEGPALVRREISYDGDAAIRSRRGHRPAAGLRAHATVRPSGAAAYDCAAASSCAMSRAIVWPTSSTTRSRCTRGGGWRPASARSRSRCSRRRRTACSRTWSHACARQAQARQTVCRRSCGRWARGPRRRPSSSFPRLGSKPTAGEVIQVAIAGSVARILRHDPGVRIGDDPEDVHQARVGTRRLRSDLRTFRSLLDPEWLAPRREELKWIADLLGHGARCRRPARAPPPPGPAPAGARRRRRRCARARDWRPSATPPASRCSRGCRRPATRPCSTISCLPRPRPRFLGEAGEPARDVLPRLVRGHGATSTRRSRDLPAVPADEDLHGVRILAKRMRYAAEAAVPAVGKEAQKLADAVSDAPDRAGRPPGRLRGRSLAPRGGGGRGGRARVRRGRAGGPAAGRGPGAPGRLARGVEDGPPRQDSGRGWQ